MVMAIRLKYLSACLVGLWCLSAIAQVSLIDHSGDPTATVQFGYLEGYSARTVGNAFENYPYFDSFTWNKSIEKDGTRVTFEGRFNTDKAAAAFEEHNKYRWSTALKAMQLKPAYGLGDNGEKELAFHIHFTVKENGFSVLSGAVALRHPETGAWRLVPMSDKALVEVIRGLYDRYDPYRALVNGLPYK